jgi:hypothetical protein
MEGSGGSGEATRKSLFLLTRGTDSCLSFKHQLRLLRQWYEIHFDLILQDEALDVDFDQISHV